MNVNLVTKIPREKKKRKTYSLRFHKVCFSVLKIKVFRDNNSLLDIKYIFIHIFTRQNVFLRANVTHRVEGSVDFTARSPHPKSGPARSFIFHKTLPSSLPLYLPSPLRPPHRNTLNVGENSGSARTGEGERCRYLVRSAG